jgi:crossover junction endodeoxyribonuclease RuvC
MKELQWDTTAKILAIDPGLSHTGVAIINLQENNTYTLQEAFTIDFKKNWTLRFKLWELYFSIFELIWKHKITDLALETPFLGRNAATFIKLGYIRGNLLLLSEIHGLHLHEFSPQAVKKIVTGFGASDKEAVLKAVQKIFPDFKTPDFYDSSDAIAIALCALRTDSRLQSILKKTSM